MKLKHFLLGIGLLSSITFSQDFTEVVSGYVRGVNDTLNFLEVEANVRIPPKGYWLWIDVSSLPFWKRVAFASILKEKNGIYPAYLYNTLTYQALFVIRYSKDAQTLVNEAKYYKSLYPSLSVVISKVDDPSIFQPIVKIGICKLPKPKIGYSGVISAINSAETIAKQIGDNTLAKYLKKIKKKIEIYIKNKSLDDLED